MDITESVWLALIGTVNIIVGGIMAVILAKVRAQQEQLKATHKDVTAVKDQVVNHHDTNLRIESDERHEQNKKILESIRLKQETHDGKIDVLLDMAVENRTRIISLEDTESRSQNGNSAEVPKPYRTRRERRAYSPPHPEGSR